MHTQAHRGGRGIAPTHLKPVLEGCGLSAPCSSRFPPNKNLVHIVQEARRFSEVIWTARKTLSSLEFDPQIVQPQQVTNCAILAPTHNSRKPTINVFHLIPFHCATQNFIWKFITCQRVFNIQRKSLEYGSSC